MYISGLEKMKNPNQVTYIGNTLQNKMLLLLLFLFFRTLFIFGCALKRKEQIEKQKKNKKSKTGFWLHSEFPTKIRFFIIYTRSFFYFSLIFLLAFITKITIFLIIIN